MNTRNIFVQENKPQQVIDKVPCSLWFNPKGDIIVGIDESANEFVFPIAHIQIPTPSVVMGRTRDEVLVHYKNQSNKSWHYLNPEVFLFRFKGKRKAKKSGFIQLPHRAKSNYVHPADSFMISQSRWYGWKWYNGEHTYFDFTNSKNGTIKEQRRSEFSVYNDVLSIGSGMVNLQNTTKQVAYENEHWQPNENLVMPINPNLFTKDENWKFDSRGGLNVIDWRNDRYAKLTGFPKGGYVGTVDENQNDGAFVNNRNKKPNIQKFYVVIAIDNPLATKTNGLQPKIYSQPSNLFLARNAQTGLVSENQTSRYFSIGSLYK